MTNDDEAIFTGLTIEEARKRYPERRENPDDPSPLITTVFAIEGDGLVSAEYTKVTAVEPTRTNENPPITGRLMPSGKDYRPPPFWLKQLYREPSYEIEEGLVKLLDLFWQRRQAIKELVARRGHELSFGTYVVIYEDQPLYCLTSKTMERLAEFGGEWGLDIVDYR